MINKIFQGDCLEVLKKFPDKSIDCVITSPPYWGLRDYGMEGQIGQEETPEEYVNKLVMIFREVKRVLRTHGTVWLNLGDSYISTPRGNREGDVSTSGLTNPSRQDGISRGTIDKTKTEIKPKNLVGIPWRVALALQNDGWYLRQDIIWSKPNPMPESVTDRCTKSHEYIFLLTRSPNYYFDNEAIKEPTTTFDSSLRNRDESKLNNTPGRTRMAGLKTNDYSSRNKRSVWTITTKPFAEAHFATFPEDLIEPMILAGTSEKGVCSCGKPWERIVEKEKTFESGSGKSGNMPIGKNGSNLQGGGDTKDIRLGPTLVSKTLGWKPNCECNTKPFPAIVLDIFMGSGTTGLVAKKLGRDYIGIELNPNYVEMAQRRINQIPQRLNGFIK